MSWGFFFCAVFQNEIIFSNQQITFMNYGTEKVFLLCRVESTAFISIETKTGIRNPIRSV